MLDEVMYKAMLDNLYEGLYFVDRDRRISFWNKGAERISGYTADEIVGHYCFDNLLKHVDDEGNKLCMNGCPLAKTLTDSQTREFNVHLKHKSGHRIPIAAKSIPILEGRSLVGAMEIFTDDPKHLAITTSLVQYRGQALTDELTQLHNRRYAEQFLQARMDDYAKLDTPFGITMFDLDLFKKVNDTYGHDAGDTTLQTIAKTMKNAIRSNDMVARWGGEEFLAVFPALGMRNLAKSAERIRMLVQACDIPVDGRQIHVTVSGGATCFKPDDSRQSLLVRADRLLYESKDSGRNRVTVR